MDDESLVHDSEEGAKALSISELKRDPDYFKKELYIGEDRRMYTRVDLEIHIPARYRERNLASISGDGTYILGTFGYVAKGRYAVSVVTSMVRITPNDTSTRTVDGDDYLVFHFKANSSVFYSADLVVQKTLVYYVYAELMLKSKIPWYMDYFDLSKIFENSKQYSDMYLAHPAIIEMMMSTVARNPNDISQFYRESVQSLSEVTTNPPTIVPFESVPLNTHSTITRLIGAYFPDGINSALINTSERPDRIEVLLR